MDVAVKIERLTEEGYLAFEANSEMRHEFVDGEVRAMSGASLTHDRIAANLVRHIGNHPAGTRCEVRTSDMNVRTPRGTYRYPDMIVECDVPVEDVYERVETAELAEWRGRDAGEG